MSLMFSISLNGSNYIYTWGQSFHYKAVLGNFLVSDNVDIRNIINPFLYIVHCLNDKQNERFIELFRNYDTLTLL